VPDSVALDVALGLIFVFVVLSLVASAIVETLSSIFAWRADFLKKGLHNLLEDPEAPGLVEEVFQHPLVSALIRPERGAPEGRLARIPGVARFVAWTRRERYPSYLPSRAVVSALLTLDVEARAAEAAGSLEDAIGRVPNVRVQESLRTLLAEATARTSAAEERVEAFRKAAETWYDDSMARVSGWYRRRVQLVLWVVALALAIALNADTLNLARVFWTDDAARAAVVAQAEEAARRADPADVERSVETLDLPLGWSFERGGAQGLPADLQGLAAKLIGLFLTGAAISLGAPFWFDLLGKVARLRSAGSPPPPRARTETT
jgi:hypothetical protein